MGRIGSIKFVNGNLLNVHCSVILHQVNCQGVMGSGVALQVKNKWPDVYKKYKWAVDLAEERGNKRELMGCIQPVRVGYDKYVCNVFSQYSYGYNEKHTDYGALKKALIKVNKYSKGRTVALPYKMGCDRGGGDWCIVYEIIEETLVDCNVIIVKLKK